jgi:hypothetical protein
MHRNILGEKKKKADGFALEYIVGYNRKNDFLFLLPQGICDERTHVAFKRDPIFIKMTFFGSFIVQSSLINKHECP